MSDFKKGTCNWCGTEGVVYADNGRCEDCDSKVAHCTICKQDYHRDDTCRHIFVDRELDWQGAGLRWLSDDSVRVSLFRLFDSLPRGFAQDVRSAISSGKFYTWFTAPLIGGGAIITLYGCRSDWGDDIAALGETEATDAADGYRWLAVLADDGCPHHGLRGT